jgi:hypothetical protein
MTIMQSHFEHMAELLRRLLPPRPSATRCIYMLYLYLDKIYMYDMP